MGRDFERVSHFEEEIRLKGITKVFLPFSWAETLSASYTDKKKMRLKGITKVFLPFSWAETLSVSHTLKKK